GGGEVDVAAADVVPYFGDGEQNRKQNGSRIDHPRRQIVGAPPQQPAREPERKRGHAVPVQQPVEDRRAAEFIADDTRLIGDARRHQHDRDGGEPAQPRQRPLIGNPRGAGYHQRERNGEPALLQGKSQRQRQRGKRAGGVKSARIGDAGPPLALQQPFGGGREG